MDTPYRDLPPEVVDVVLHGTKGELFPIVPPEGATKGQEHVAKLFRYDGIVNEIGRRYRRYRREKIAHTWMEEYLKRVMVEQTCPDCQGTKLKRQRLLVTVDGKNIIEAGDLTIAELSDFLANLPPLRRQRAAGEQIVCEVLGRLDLLLEIGLDYLSLNRKAVTLSGGESQRVRLSVQIGSDLMGMLYVLDEPSIGLHACDNDKMIRTLQRLLDSLSFLVDAGNTVLVIEHHRDVIKTADWIIDLGPGGGKNGGEIVAQGPPEVIATCPRSYTGQFLRDILVACDEPSLAGVT